MTHHLPPSSPRQTTILPPWTQAAVRRYRRTRDLVRGAVAWLLLAACIAVAAWGLGAAVGR
jgi:hypothetical protein